MFNTAKKLALLALPLALGLSPATPAMAQIVLNPDPCTSKLTPGPISTQFLAAVNTKIYWTAGSLPSKKVALIVNGNGIGMHGFYEALTSHLAENGFIAASFIRPGDVFDVLDAVLAARGISKTDPALEIALVGHSRGGEVVIEAAEANTAGNLGYPISAVATLAPAVTPGVWLDGNDIDAYLTIYGSQDEDVDAYDNEVNEAFYTYDTCGTEGSTTCNQPPCGQTVPAFDKTMVFIYGADHIGLIGEGAIPNIEQLPQDLDYVSPATTLCVTKAYLTGFLRYHIYNENTYKGMLRGDWKPLSLAFATNAEADGFGNPAGSPLRYFLQNSPVQKKTIQSFSAGLGTFSKTAQTTLQHYLDGGMATWTPHVRHFTEFARVGWDATNSDQYVRFDIPAGSRTATNFTHFSLRIGQLYDAGAPYNNTINTNQNVWLVLQDAANVTSWHQLTAIPTPDWYTASGPIQAQSHMTTRRIPVSALNANLNKADIRSVYLYFSQGTHGTVIVDNLEWHRD